MTKKTWFVVSLLAASLAIGLAGCGSEAEEKLPEAATQGGNVINDPELKKQLTGDTASGGGGQSSSAPTGG